MSASAQVCSTLTQSHCHRLVQEFVDVHTCIYSFEVARILSGGQLCMKSGDCAPTLRDILTMPDRAYGPAFDMPLDMHAPFEHHIRVSVLTAAVLRPEDLKRICLMYACWRAVPYRMLYTSWLT